MTASITLIHRHPVKGLNAEALVRVALTTADVEDAAAGRDALDEEVVIAGQPVLGVLAFAVRHGALADQHIEAVDKREQPLQALLRRADPRFDGQQTQDEESAETKGNQTKDKGEPFRGP